MITKSVVASITKLPVVKSPLYNRMPAKPPKAPDWHILVEMKPRQGR